MKRLKELEEENARLKKVCAEEKLKAEIVSEALEKSGEAISTQRDGAASMTEKQVSIRVTCAAFRISQTCYRYKRKLSDDNAPICRLAAQIYHSASPLGLWPVLSLSSQCEGIRPQPQAGVPICRELELNLGIKPRRRLQRDRPDPLEVPSINQVWSIDFIYDRLDNGCSL